jgi:phosphoglycerate dehydrogenase-like enzyme
VNAQVNAPAPVLVAEELREFLDETEVPDDIAVTILAAREPVPQGPFVGLLPLLVRSLGAEEMDRLSQLRVIANYGVGHDNIDLAAARARGIAVSNTPGALTMATAELTWALILAAARRLPEGERLVRSGKWAGWHPTQLLGMGLDGRVLGIVGAGGSAPRWGAARPRSTWASCTGAAAATARSNAARARAGSRWTSCWRPPTSSRSTSP